MKCLVIINIQSGKSRSAPDEGALLCALKKEFSEVQTLHITRNSNCNLQAAVCGYDALVVCGGDGTLSSVLCAFEGNCIPIRYYPCGTVNDAARTAKALGNCRSILPMRFGKKLFSYVAATGTFTPIAWLPSEKFKKTCGRLSYLFYAVKEYKIHNSEAQIAIDGTIHSGCYTLIMALRSRYVFALPVNRVFSAEDKSPKYLLIKTPTGAFKYTKLFFLFFRAFVVGFTSAYHSKNMDFDTFRNMRIHLAKPADFCLDGERERSVSDVEITDSEMEVRCEVE